MEYFIESIKHNNILLGLVFFLLGIGLLFYHLRPNNEHLSIFDDKSFGRWNEYIGIWFLIFVLLYLSYLLIF